jgi:hypothetical protein
VPATSPLIYISQEASWAPDPIERLCRKEKIYRCWESNPGRAVCSLVTVVTELTKILIIRLSGFDALHLVDSSAKESIGTQSRRNKNPKDFNLLKPSGNFTYHQV